MFYKLLVEHSRDYSNYSVESGKLAFVEPTKAGEIATLEMTFEKEELEHLRLLITKIWEHITALNLPDTSGYDQSLKGIQAFEQDLLNDAV